jgi:hypothetical protein
MGLRQSFGLFVTPVNRDLALNAADFTLTIAVQNIVWGLSQAPVGAIVDRFGLHVTLVAGTVGLAVMAGAGGEMILIVSSVLIGIALSCTAPSLALAALRPGSPRSRSWRNPCCALIWDTQFKGTKITTKRCRSDDGRWCTIKPAANPFPRCGFGPVQRSLLERLSGLFQGKRAESSVPPGRSRAGPACGWSGAILSGERHRRHRR